MRIRLSAIVTMDFGLARETNASGALGGTLPCMSPEVIAGRPAPEALELSNSPGPLHPSARMATCS